MEILCETAQQVYCWIHLQGGCVLSCALLHSTGLECSRCRRRFLPQALSSSLGSEYSTCSPESPWSPFQGPVRAPLSTGHHLEDTIWKEALGSASCDQLDQLLFLETTSLMKSTRKYRAKKRRKTSMNRKPSSKSTKGWAGSIFRCWPSEWKQISIATKIMVVVDRFAKFLNQFLSQSLARRTGSRGPEPHFFKGGMFGSWSRQNLTRRANQTVAETARRER